MDLDEIATLASDNHRILIVLGCIICFISIFLPFWSVNSYLQLSLFNSWMFWPYLLIIVGVGIGYFLEYGKRQPRLFLAAGAILVIMTIYATLIGSSVLTDYLTKVGANAASGMSSYLGSGYYDSLISSTLDNTIAYVVKTAQISLSYGFVLELIGSLAIAVGGYYYSITPEQDKVSESPVPGPSDLLS